MSTTNFRDPKPLHIQSNGGGIQSFAMYLMSCLGYLPRFDYSIFVDLGHEKPGTYKAISFLKKWSIKNNGIPIITLSDKNLLNDSIDAIKNEGKRFASIPFFSSGTSGKVGMLRRQCTGEYKIRQVNAAIKSLYNLSGNQRFPETFIYIGISIDEMLRISKPEKVKFTNIFPFCLYQTGFHSGIISFRDPKMLKSHFSRNNCIDWLHQHNFFVPPKSSCVFCPYTSDKDWLDLKISDPESFSIASKFDSEMRDFQPGKLNSKLFLHKSVKPLSLINFKKSVTLDLFECEGYCHT